MNHNFRRIEYYFQGPENFPERINLFAGDDISLLEDVILLPAHGALVLRGMKGVWTGMDWVFTAARTAEAGATRILGAVEVRAAGGEWVSAGLILVTMWRDQVGGGT